MAYILGFTCADGCVHSRTLSWELSNKFCSDKNLLEKIAKEIGSTYKIEERRSSFRLRINSVALISSLSKFGIVPNKTKILVFPSVPVSFLRHFIRGFLDGDGWISMRAKRKSNEINLGFVNGSRDFMEGLVQALKTNVPIRNFNLRSSHKTTKNGSSSVYFHIDFYGKDVYEILSYLFEDLSDEDLFLDRKYKKQQEAIKLFHESQRRLKFGKKWVKLELENNLDVSQELISMFLHEKVSPKEIASNFKVSLSTIYRWLEKINLRIPAEKGSLEWKRRIFGGRTWTRPIY